MLGTSSLNEVICRFLRGSGTRVSDCSFSNPTLTPALTATLSCANSARLADIFAAKRLWRLYCVYRRLNDTTCERCLTYKLVENHTINKRWHKPHPYPEIFVGSIAWWLMRQSAATH